MKKKAQKKERRADTRLEVQLTGKGTLNIEGQELQMEVMASSISAFGAYCLTDAPPAIGDEVKLRLQWSSENKQSEIIFKAVGTVLRVDSLPEGKYGFALEFDQTPVLVKSSSPPKS